jgi:hypothetical protein
MTNYQMLFPKNQLIIAIGSDKHQTPASITVFDPIRKSPRKIETP